MYDPDITLPNCATDRSLAIAHDLESPFWEEILADTPPKSKAGRAPKRPATKKAKAPTEDDTYALGDDDADNGADADESDNGDSNTTGTGKWRPKQIPPEELQQLIATRTSPAVKAALEALASAPTSGRAKKSAEKSSRS